MPVTVQVWGTARAPKAHLIAMSRRDGVGSADLFGVSREIDQIMPELFDIGGLTAVLTIHFGVTLL